MPFHWGHCVSLSASRLVRVGLPTPGVLRPQRPLAYYYQAAIACYAGMGYVVSIFVTGMYVQV